MLKFERAVQAEDTDYNVYVFVDVEKGHTVYMSHTGSISVIEEENKPKTKERVAGFFVNNSCSDCNGC